MRPSCGCGTRAWALPPTCCPASSTCSRRRNGRSTARRAASASAWRWCKKLVEMHGGSVEARSDGPGQGSEFVVRLPALPETTVRAEANSRLHAPRSAATADAASWWWTTTRTRRESLAMLLRLWGHEVRPGPRRHRGVGGGRAFPTGRGAAGHRTAGPERLRGRPPPSPSSPAWRGLCSWPSAATARTRIGGSRRRPGSTTT